MPISHFPPDGRDRCRPGRSIRQRGAVLVEFALLAPILFGLLFGIVDFGYTFSRTLDIRHGAREGARLAAVNYTGGTANVGATQSSLIISAICDRMDGAEGASVSITLNPGTNSAPAGSVGQSATINVSRPATSLSGLYKPIFDGKTIRSAITTRVEVSSSWSTASGTCT